MMSRYIKQKSQSLVEYSFILVVVAAALVSMQMYMKRGIQAAVKIQADQLGPQQITINTSPREQSSTNTISFEEKEGTRNKQVFLGGSQTIEEDSTLMSSGSANSVDTLDWTYP